MTVIVVGVVVFCGGDPDWMQLGCSKQCEWIYNIVSSGGRERI